MRFDIVTLFPESVVDFCSHSLLAKASEKNLIKINAINPRDFTTDKHRKVDDMPYGGGQGMVLKCQPFVECINSIEKKQKSKIIMLTPQGRTFRHEIALEYAKMEQLVLVCGRYEGFDERIKLKLETNYEVEELSIGDFVLTGGELGALCVVDAVARHVEGVLGHEDSSKDDSFANGLLEYPQYTRPYDYEGLKVPDVLMSGHHKEIDNWRKQQSLEKTKKKRYDLYDKWKLKNARHPEKQRSCDVGISKDNEILTASPQNDGKE